MTDTQINYMKAVAEQNRVAEQARANQMNEAMKERQMTAEYGINYVPVNNASGWNINYPKNKAEQDLTMTTARNFGQFFGNVFGGGSGGGLIGGLLKSLL